MRLFGWLPHRQALRRGASGASVRWLQERLRHYGYDVEDIDGRYGFLTEDAVMAFQRDRRLRVDGVAGRQVLAAIGQDLPRQRRIHEVEPGERLVDIAARYGVSVDALRWMNGLSRRREPKSGDRLSLWTSYVVLGSAPGAADIVVDRSLSAAGALHSAVVRDWAACRADGSIDEGSAPSEARLESDADRILGLRGTGAGELVRALLGKKSRRELLAALEQRLASHGGAGLFVAADGLSYGEGVRFQRALVELRRLLADGLLAVELPPPPTGWRGLAHDLDYATVAGVCDFMVLALHRWDVVWPGQRESPDWQAIEAHIARTSRQAPPWKLLLGVPLNVGLRRGGFTEAVPHRQAVVSGYAARTRLKPAPGGFLSMRIQDDGETRTYVAQGRPSLARFLALGYRYRLAGYYLAGVGEEEHRLWQVVGDRTIARRASGDPT